MGQEDSHSAFLLSCLQAGLLEVKLTGLENKVTTDS